MERLIDEILEDLLIELDIEKDTKDADLLRIKVKNALWEVVTKMNFPKYYQEYVIEKEVRDKRNVIHNVAMYDFCQVGSEWQKSHTESNVNMTFADRNSLFTFIPYATI